MTALFPERDHASDWTKVLVEVERSRDIKNYFGGRTGGGGPLVTGFLHATLKTLFAVKQIHSRWSFLNHSLIVTEPLKEDMSSLRGGCSWLPYVLG